METGSVEFPVQWEMPTPNSAMSLAFPPSPSSHTHSHLTDAAAKRRRAVQLCEKFPCLKTRTTHKTNMEGYWSAELLYKYSHVYKSL